MRWKARWWLSHSGAPLKVHSCLSPTFFVALQTVFFNGSGTLHPLCPAKSLGFALLCRTPPRTADSNVKKELPLSHAAMATAFSRGFASSFAAAICAAVM